MHKSHSESYHQRLPTAESDYETPPRQSWRSKFSISNSPAKLSQPELENEINKMMRPLRFNTYGGSLTDRLLSPEPQNPFHPIKNKAFNREFDPLRPSSSLSEKKAFILKPYKSANSDYLSPKASPRPHSMVGQSINELVLYKNELGKKLKQKKKLKTAVSEIKKNQFKADSNTNTVCSFYERWYNDSVKLDQNSEKLRCERRLIEKSKQLEKEQCAEYDADIQKNLLAKAECIQNIKSEKATIAELKKMISSMKQELSKEIKEREKLKVEVGISIKRAGQLDLKYRNLLIEKDTILAGLTDTKSQMSARQKALLGY